MTKTKPSAQRYAEILDTVKQLRSMIAEQTKANLDFEEWFRAGQLNEADNLIADAQTALMANEPTE